MFEEHFCASKQTFENLQQIEIRKDRTSLRVGYEISFCFNEIIFKHHISIILMPAIFITSAQDRDRIYLLHTYKNKACAGFLLNYA